MPARSLSWPTRLVDDFDVVDLLTRLAGRCVEVLDVDSAGIMLAAPDGRFRVLASSSEAMRVLELFEVQAQEGPCLDAHHTGLPVVNQNLADLSGRWPRFAPEALAAGFRTVHAVPMRLRTSAIGALNLFRSDLGELGPGDIEIAKAFADVATIAILQDRATQEVQLVNEQLTHALNSRAVIEQAKGMIAERLGLDMEQSFEALPTMPASTTFVCPTSPAPSSMGPWRRRRSTPCRRRGREGAVDQGRSERRRDP